jgi:hypothetical protein
MFTRFMPERLLDDPTLPPPGRRTGAGSASILPYLLKTLASRPQGPGIAEQGGAQDEQQSSQRQAAAGGAEGF